jgi:hypothetical protein
VVHLYTHSLHLSLQLSVSVALHRAPQCLAAGADSPRRIAEPAVGHRSPIRVSIPVATVLREKLRSCLLRYMYGLAEEIHAVRPLAAEAPSAMASAMLDGQKSMK